jgi:DNA mismatch endonuclease (patch repair protein)
VDVKNPEQRSRNMAAIKGRHTKPELAVRRLLHSLGFRFRLHRKDLPGRPDIVLPRYKTVVLVHGCFWHQHPGCRFARQPASRQEFWEQKLSRNVERDRENTEKLIALDWQVIVVWECDLKNANDLADRLCYCLKGPMATQG